MLGMVPWWATLLIMGREIGITLLRFAVLRHGIIPASRGGKAKTLAQAIAIGFYLVPLPELIGADTAVAWVRGVLLGIAVVLTVGTGIDYVLRAMRLRAAAPCPTRRTRDERDRRGMSGCIEGLFALGGRDTGSVRRRGSVRLGTVIPPERFGQVG